LQLILRYFAIIDLIEKGQIFILIAELCVIFRGRRWVGVAKLIKKFWK